MPKPDLRDLRERPLYTATEAARFLRLPSSTVRAWLFGQNYHVAEEVRRFRAVIVPADPAHRLLSFMNLVELTVLGSIRRKHRITLPQVRQGVAFLRRAFPSRHPLADHAFLTNGIELFTEKFGKILNVTREGQVEIREALEGALRSIDRDPAGVPFKLYLPTADAGGSRRGAIVIDPAVGFGRPIIDGTGIRTEVVLGRFRAGEPIESLASDYERTREEIEDIVRSEIRLAA
jgi:uncharacterized protein (DUF433 family)